MTASDSERALQRKTQLVEEFLDRVQPATVWDLGANTGHFSRLASARGIVTMAFDLDPACVERNYLDSPALEDRRTGRAHCFTPVA